MIARQAEGSASTIADTMPRSVGPLLLDLGDLPQVDRERSIGDEFDVVDGQQTLPVNAHASVSVGDVQHRRSEGLPDHAAPPGLEGRVHLVTRVRRRRRREPEGVG